MLSAPREIEGWAGGRRRESRKPGLGNHGGCGAGRLRAIRWPVQLDWSSVPPHLLRLEKESKVGTEGQKDKGFAEPKCVAQRTP